MKKLEKYKLHIKNESAEGQYLCISCDNGDRYGSRPITKRELIELYHDITNCFVGGYKTIANASLKSSINIYKKGKAYILCCRDDGNKFHVDKYSLLPLQGEIERTLHSKPKNWNILNAAKNTTFKQLKLF